MKLTVGAVVLAAFNLSAATHYVSLQSTNPTPPYTDWTTAATNIQDAVDAAAPGDEIVVTNGVYQTGGRAVYGMSNRVAVTKRVAVRSVNGPAMTHIMGSKPIGATAVRCVYLTNEAVLAGFTLTNGATQFTEDLDERRISGGGVWCEGLSALVSNCVLTGNAASYSGGGAFCGTLTDCVVSGNSGGYYGGGAYCDTLNACTLTGNSAREGGGAYGCTLRNCTLTGNSGSGVTYSALYNCIVYGNPSLSQQINYDSTSTLTYCCVIPLPTDGIGNLALDPQLASSSHLSANSPCRGAGSAAYANGTDIDGEPWSLPPSIGCDEYCSGAVTGSLTAGIGGDRDYIAPGYALNLTAQIEGRTTQSLWDFGDGTTATNQPITSHVWATPGDYRVALWAFNETHPEGVCGTLTIHVGQSVHFVDAANVNPVWPFTSWASAATNIQNAVDAAGPGSVVWVTNGVYAGGGRPVTEWEPNRVLVDKPLTLRSVNGPPSTIIDGGGEMRCVYLGNGAVLSGFTLTNGAGAAWGGGVCCETTAVVSNCLIVGNSAVGNWVSDSLGGGAYGGTLYRCTLSGNRAPSAPSCGSIGHGGGACASTLYDCMLTENTSPNGGGVDSCRLKNCVLRGNSAEHGGGACDSTLNNCTLTGNSATYGGGAEGGTLNNCIVYFNTAPTGANYERSDNPNYSTLNYCCTTPLPTNGLGNITKPPSFVNTNGWSNLRLQTNSPCINAGNNSYLTNSYFTNCFDPDGNPRIAGATADIGAYEFQGVGLSGFPAWLWQYGLSIDGAADAADSDHDGLSNRQEWLCATCPTNAQSVLSLLPPTLMETNLVVTWSSVAGMDYYLERSTNPASPFSLLATNLAGQEGFTSYEDTKSTGSGPFFYRVGVSHHE